MEYGNCGCLIDLIFRSTLREDHMTTIGHEVSAFLVFATF